MNLVSRPRLEVATSFVLIGRKRRRDMDLRSRRGMAFLSSVGGRDLDFGVATWKSHCGQKRGRNMKLMSRHRLVSRRVATWLWCCNLALDWAGETVSRPRFEVMTGLA